MSTQNAQQTVKELQSIDPSHLAEVLLHYFSSTVYWERDDYVEVSNQLLLLYNVVRGARLQEVN